jgi:uncharacterized protein (TIGR03086 family)
MSAIPEEPAMPTTDLGPAATTVAQVLAGITDEQLAAPTPCPRYTVGDLLDHVGGLSLAFTAAATKTPLAAAGPDTPLGDATNLDPDWRETIPAALDDLASAWREDAAWDGMTTAGSIEMPGEIAGLVALDELVVHGWDLARATGQPYAVDDTTLGLIRGLVADFAPAGDVVNDGTLPFGPAVSVPADAPLLDQVVALTGRDPAWSPR